ncbi:MAG: sensor signal transduction histidine kinase [Flaviaesturariibacter sp.]|nr:sensor signal transduction histidine kinase [Flaviaesturariibacter sp.]
MPNYSFSFLQGGGEMGLLTRSFPWETTSVGAPDSWPQSLRTTISIVLNSKFPMVLFWGKDSICFYNDAFRPSLGDNGKHPSALGKPAVEVWKESWSIISPLLSKVKEEGEAVWSEDQLIPMNRNGRLEEVYWTFSYSPVKGENDVDGVLVVCTETTRKVESLNSLKNSDQRFQNLVRETTVGIIVLIGPEMKVAVVNDAYGNLIELTPAELLGKELFSVIPDAEEMYRPILDKVRTTGEPIYLYASPYRVQMHGKWINGWLDVVYQPYREADGTISGVMALCHDVTEAMRIRKRLEENELQLRAIVENAPFPIGVYIGREMRIHLANQNIIDVWGKGQDVIGKRYAELLPELANQQIYEQLDNVYMTGIPFHARNKRVDLLVDGKILDFYFNYSFTPLLDTEGKVYGVLNTAAEVTDLNRALRQVAKSQQRFSAAVAAVQGIIWTNNAAGEMEGEQPGWASITGQSYEEYQGFGWASAVHPDDAQASVDAWNEAVRERKTFVFEHRVKMHNGEWGLFSIRAVPLLNEEGMITEWVGVHTDITAQRATELAVKQSDLFARSIIENSPVAKVVFIGKEMEISMVNERMLEMLGRDASIIGKRFVEAIPELKESSLAERLRHVLETGETYYQPEERIDLFRFGKPYVGYYNYTYKALPNIAGQYYGVIVTATEVTDLVLTRKAIEDTEAALRVAVELSELGTWNLDPVTRTVYYSDRLNEWFGWKNEPHRVEEIYERILPEYHARIRESMNRALTPGSDGIYDVEYMITHLATGRQRLIHAQGKALANPDGSIYKVEGMAQDVTEQRRAQAELESMVQERTEELQAVNERLIATNEELGEANDLLMQSNRELEEFSYAASHDMQEPLRKIQTFSSFLLDNHAEQLNEKGRNFLHKIGSSVARMKTIIDDLLRYSHQTREHQEAEPTNLNVILQNIEADLELIIHQKDATIAAGNLPVIEAVPTQMHQLFYNLLTNALKFSKPDAKPQVSIQQQELNAEDIKRLGTDNPAEFIKIVFADNGIGFHQEYAEQIFSLFKRLHAKTEYEGTGIGLGLCKKIVKNHHGMIYATSELGEGANFHILLPTGK